jgi:hypothetical protein
LLAVVVSESLAVLAALLARREEAVFVDVSLFGWLLGLALYPLVVWQIALDLRRELRFAPEPWVLMGALAIATPGRSRAPARCARPADNPRRGACATRRRVRRLAARILVIVPLAAFDGRARSSRRYTGSRWSSFSRSECTRSQRARSRVPTGSLP